MTGGNAEYCNMYYQLHDFMSYSTYLWKRAPGGLSTHDYPTSLLYCHRSSSKTLLLPSNILPTLAQDFRKLINVFNPTIKTPRPSPTSFQQSTSLSPKIYTQMSITNYVNSIHISSWRSKSKNRRAPGMSNSNSYDSLNFGNGNNTHYAETRT